MASLLTFTCSHLTKETLETQGRRFEQVNVIWVQAWKSFGLDFLLQLKYYMDSENEPVNKKTQTN